MIHENQETQEKQLLVEDITWSRDITYLKMIDILIHQLNGMN